MAEGKKKEGTAVKKGSVTVFRDGLSLEKALKDGWERVVPVKVTKKEENPNPEGK